MSKLRIFLADDHAIIREGLKSLIEAQPDMIVVGETDNGRGAWREAKALHPDVVVMDISMPELNGAKATELLKRDCPETKVLALTVHNDQGYLHQLLKAGASGYVLKRAAPHELIRAIRVVAAGETYLDPTIVSDVVGSYVRKQSTREGQPQGELSEREAEVLRLIALGYSNKEIATRLDISVRTVETYKARLMEKLNFHSRAEIVRYALLQGWLEES
ncbi:MAG TPA: response regulator transcription factor [Pyrinomonadaceae bacterium]|nr:response regulator transcription factor [Pyrinomonadaceae bacterium]